jgi:hypothetical protein
VLLAVIGPISSGADLDGDVAIVYVFEEDFEFEMGRRRNKQKTETKRDVTVSGTKQIPPGSKPISNQIIIQGRMKIIPALRRRK